MEVAGVASGPRTPTEMCRVVVNVRRAKVDLGSYATRISSGLFIFTVPGVPQRHHRHKGNILCAKTAGAPAGMKKSLVKPSLL